MSIIPPRSRPGSRANAFHALWPEGFSRSFDWILALIAGGAGIALFRFKLGVMQQLCWCALFGLGLTAQPA